MEPGDSSKEDFSDMKKSQKIIMAMFLALLAGSLIVTGCSTDTETQTEYVSGRVIPFDKVVSVLSDLTDALADPDAVYILVKNNISLSGNLSIPAGKHVYLYAELDTASKDLTIGGSVVVADTGSLIADSINPVKVTGSISVEEGGVLSIEDEDSVKDGTGTSTVLGTKVTFAGGDLAYDPGSVFSSTGDIVTALGYMSSGVLEITGSGLKPSEIVDSVKDIVSSTKRLSIDLGSKVEDATTLNIPVGLAITTTDDLSDVTNLAVNGVLTASSGALKNSGAVLVVGPNAEVELGGVKLTEGSTIKAGATAVINGITFPKSSTDANITAASATEVTIENNYTLSGVLNIETGSTLNIGGIFGFSAMNAQIRPAGEGTLITTGSGYFTIMTIKFMTSDIEADDFMAAATAIIGDYNPYSPMCLFRKTVALAEDFDSSTQSGIGSVFIEADATATSVRAEGNAAGIGSELVVSDNDDTYTYNAVDTTEASITVGGTNADDVDDSDFTLSVESDGKLSIADSGYDDDLGAKFVVLAFTGVKLSNGDLYTILPQFKIGVKTSR
jgi:hypothetical protein